MTDVGAGAGSQSRATDTHLVLRAHEEQDVTVLDGAVRSWPPLAPFCLRWCFPVWIRDDNLDPLALRSERSRRKSATPPKPHELAKQQPWDAKRFAATYGREKPVPALAMIDEAITAGLSERQATGLLKRAEAIGAIYRWRLENHRSFHYATMPQPKDEGMRCSVARDGTKRQRVLQAIRQHPIFTNREIGEQCNVHSSYVGRLRKTLANQS